MSVESTLWFGAALLSAMYVGAYLHELTHVAAVWAVGGRVRSVSLLHFWVEWEVPDSTSMWQVRLIGLAPTLVGLLLFVPVTLAATQLSIRGILVLVLAYAIYAFNGGVEDYRLTEAVEA